jgi:hypothetical protein
LLDLDALRSSSVHLHLEILLLTGIDADMDTPRHPRLDSSEAHTRMVVSILEGLPEEDVLRQRLVSLIGDIVGCIQRACTEPEQSKLRARALSNFSEYRSRQI